MITLADPLWAAVGVEVASIDVVVVEVNERCRQSAGESIINGQG
jgi:hypothetical protein